MTEENTEELTETEVRLKEKNLYVDKHALSLGVFGIFLVGLVLAVILYVLLLPLTVCFPRILQFELAFNDRLFYNAWIRYLIESNLTTTHNCIFYLFITAWQM